MIMIIIIIIITIIIIIIIIITISITIMTIITVYCHYNLGCFMMTMIKTSIYIKAARDTATITTMISTSEIDRQIPSQSL